MALPQLGNGRALSEVLGSATSLLLFGLTVNCCIAALERATCKPRFLPRINETWNPRLGRERTVLLNLKCMLRL